MKRNINIISIILVCVLCVLPKTMFSQQKDNHNQSKQLIERYNKFRSNRSLPNGDSIIDNVTNEILLDKRYRNSFNEFDEDSIRYLFYNKGVMDYKFETKEIHDNDTSTVFNAFLLGDSSSNIRIGYARNGSKHLIVKTKSYLKYDHAEIFIPDQHKEIGRRHIQADTLWIKTDSVKFYVKQLVPGKYYFHYSTHIPSSSELIKNQILYQPEEVIVNNNGMKNINFDLIFTSKHSDMYLIVTNDKNEKIAILK